MKKKLAAGLIIPALGAGGDADAADGDDVLKWGPIIGATSAGATLLENYFYNEVPRRSLNRVAVGLGLKVPMGATTRFQPELQYTQFGSRIGGEFGITIRYEFIAAPLLFRFDLPTAEEGKIKPFFLVGPQIGFELSEDTHRGVVLYSFYYVDLSNDYQDGGFPAPLDAGAAAGIGVEIPVDNIDLQLSLRFYHGALSNLSIVGVELNRQGGLYAGLYF